MGVFYSRGWEVCRGAMDGRERRMPKCTPNRKGGVNSMNKILKVTPNDDYTLLVEFEHGFPVGEGDGNPYHGRGRLQEG